MFLGLESVKICRLDLEVDLLNFFKKRQAIGGASNHNFLTKMNIIAYLISCLHHPPSLNPFYFVSLTLAQTIYNSLERKINGSVFAPPCSRTKKYRTSSSHKGVARCGVFHARSYHSSFNMAGVVMVQYGLMGSSSLFGMMLSVLGNALRIALFYVII